MPPLPSFLKIFFLVIFVCLCVVLTPQHTHGGQREICGGCFSSSATWLVRLDDKCL